MHLNLKSNRDIEHRRLMQEMNQNNLNAFEDRISYSKIDDNIKEIYWIP